MSWVAFEARIEPLEWGLSTYTILRLPADVLEALRHPRRVEGEVADHPIEAGVARADVIADAFLYTGRAFLAAAGVEPGARVDVRLRPADPDRVETPADVAAAIRAAGRLEAWEALSPGRRRGALHLVATARREATRTRRIAALVADLA